MVMFASEDRKDSVAFIEETREFVCNLATFDLRQQMNKTSGPYPRGVDEMRDVRMRETGQDAPRAGSALRWHARRGRR